MKETYKGYDIEVSADQDPYNPREDDNMGKMLCSHRRYDLGDKIAFDFDRFHSWDEVEEHLRKEMGAIIILPLYLYDHSGITMSTKPFSCHWDSGQVGFIYATRKDILDNYMIKRISKKTLEKAEKLLKAEVEIYDNYLTGEVYQYVVSKDGNMVECCGGFNGAEEDCLSDAKSIADSLVESVEA